MRTLVVLRHAMRHKPGLHLSQEGISLARLVADTYNPFSLVVTSTLPRAAETAIAMGFEVHDMVEVLADLPNEVFNEVGWPNSFARLAQIVTHNTNVMAFAQGQAKLWNNIAGQISDSHQALIISHGIFVELGAIASMPEANHESWGEAIGYCEGVRLCYDENHIRCEVLRVPNEHYLIDNKEM